MADKKKINTPSASFLKALLSGATFDFVDEIGGVAGELFLPEPGVKLGPSAYGPTIKEQNPDGGDPYWKERQELRELVENRPSNYQLTRDLVRKDLAQAEEDHPDLTKLGKVAGLLAIPMKMK